MQDPPQGQKPDSQCRNWTGMGLGHSASGKAKVQAHLTGGFELQARAGSCSFPAKSVRGRTCNMLTISFTINVLRETSIKALPCLSASSYLKHSVESVVYMQKHNAAV